jgi:hypothetical protein
VSTDTACLEALEQCTLPVAEFTHAAHVRAGYLYLLEQDFPQALARMSASIRRYAVHLGKSDLYHETITVAYMALIQQHMRERGSADGYESFAHQNPELFGAALLRPFYTAAELKSAAARRMFLLPRTAVRAEP